MHARLFHVLFGLVVVSGCSRQPCTSPDWFGYGYEVVPIGDQCWFAENLRSEYYRNGDEIVYEQEDQEWKEANAGRRCSYAHDENKSAFFAQLYNGYTVLDERGLCPWGWHVPKDEEWTDLVAFLSEGAVDIEAEGWNGLADWEVGQMLKSTCCWMPEDLSDVPGLSAQDAYGFRALPAGERGFGGFFSNAGNYGSGKWWTASTIAYEPARQNEIRYRFIDFSDSELHQASAMMTRGLSVRCVED